jgi:hypothetical protein
MSRPKKQINLNGNMVDATPISPTSSSEHWNQYLLEDGTIIRMKLVATEFLKVEGQRDAEGNPVYAIKSTNVTSIEAPGRDA